MRILVDNPDRPSPLGTRAGEDNNHFPLSALAENGGGEVPFPTPALPAPSLPQHAGPEYKVVLGRADSYEARRFHNYVLLVAKGTVPCTNYRTDFAVSPFLIAPPQFNFLFLIPPMCLTALRPFVHTELFPFPKDKNVVVIHDANGRHVYHLDKARSFAETFKLDLKPKEYFGASTRSLEQALEQAVGQAETDITPKNAADLEYTFTITESGKIKGGIAGRDVFYVKINARY